MIDYLTKPFGRDRLREAVTRGLEWHESAWDARRWRESLEQEMTIRRARLSEAIAGVRVDSDDQVDSMFAMLTLTDREMYGHGYRVAALAVSIARILGLPDEAFGTIEHGALLHDIGKLALPEAILRKPAPLTVEELLLVRRHPAIGSELFASRTVPARVRCRLSARPTSGWTASAIPHGVHAAEVSIGARIVSRRRRLRHDDQASRVSRRDQLRPRRCSSSSAAAARSSIRSIVEAFSQRDPGHREMLSVAIADC